MSTFSSFKPSAICSQRVTLENGTVNVVLGGGAGNLAFNPNTSKILGIRGDVTAAAPAVPGTSTTLAVTAVGTGITAAQIGAGQCPVTITSQNAGDVGVYVVSWINEVGSGYYGC